MKLLCFTVLLMLSAAFTLAAEESTSNYIYGYPAEGITLQDTLVSGQIKTATISGFSNSKHTGMHYALLDMPANVANTLGGCQITKVAFYPFLTTMAKAKIIISKEIGSEVLYEQEVTGINSQTWHVIDLDTPYIINKDEHVYIGYSIESAQGDYPVGYYYTSNPAAQAVIDPILDYIGYEEDGAIKSGLLDTQMYAARRQTANLMLYAVIENQGQPIPENGVAVGALSFSNDIYIKPNNEQKLTVLYNNTATKPLERFNVTIKNGEQTVVEQTVGLTTPLQPMAEGKFTVNMPTSEVGLHKINVTIDNPNGKENSYTGEKTASKGYLVYNETTKRNVLLEHFTTGACTGCVNGETQVANEVAKVNAGINVIRINHHSGYESDKLTQADDKAYEWFYGGAYLWAPACMIDRTDLAAYGAKGYGGTATTGPVFSMSKSNATISSLITSAASLPAFVNLNVKATTDENRVLTVNVNANELYEMPQADMMRLNVAIVQDSVKAVQMLADGSANKNYIHYNVFRTNLTGTWGEAVEFENNAMSKTFTYTVPAAWNIDKLRVVAFLADYDASSNKNCRVYNVAQTRPNEPIKGDVNGDGVVDVSDLNEIISVILGETSTGIVDVNEDGTVDISDINDVITIILNL